MVIILQKNSTIPSTFLIKLFSKLLDSFKFFYPKIPRGSIWCLLTNLHAVDCISNFHFLIVLNGICFLVCGIKWFWFYIKFSSDIYD